MMLGVFDGVPSYASSAGFGVVFAGDEPCKSKKKPRSDADLRTAAAKLIRSVWVVTPARRDFDNYVEIKILAMIEKPRSFFKFVPFERKDILKNGPIRFTPIGEFNDPFELEPIITPLSENFLKYISQLSEEESKTIEYSEEDREFSSERESQLDAYKKIYRKKAGEYGVLSLTSNTDINPLLPFCVPEKRAPRTNLLMWSHYAKSHSGFVIEFDDEFMPGLKIEGVEYSNYRGCLTFEDIDNNNFHRIFHKKSVEWSYEQEYRAVLPLSKATEVVDDKFHLFSFNKKGIRSITFGCSMDEEKNKVSWI